MGKFLLKSLALFSVFVAATVTHASAFPDVQTAHDNFDAVEYVFKQEIVSGYPDGTFQPGVLINRAEFTKIIIEAAYPGQAAGVNCFPDVKDEWFAKYVCFAKNAGIISGYPDGSFKPVQFVSFVEAAKIIVNAFKYSTSSGAIWYEPFVVKLSQESAIPTTIAYLSKSVTRGEMAEIIYRLKKGVKDKQSMFYENDLLLGRTFFDGALDGAGASTGMGVVIGNGTSSDVGKGILDHRVINNAALGFGNKLPPKGVSLLDPVYGTSIVRLTNATDSGSYAVHDYSQLQAFSPSKEYVLMAVEGDYKIMKMSDLSFVSGVDNVWNDARWQPGKKNTLVAYDTNEDITLKVIYTNAETAKRTTIYTFPAKYQRIRSNQSFDDPSRSGKWMAGMASTNSSDQLIFSLDLNAAEAAGSGDAPIGVEFSLNQLYSTVCDPDPQWGNVEPDWIGVSPLDNYMVIQWARDGLERCSGMELFDVSTGQFVGHVTDRHDHGDLGVNAARREVFVSIGIDSEISGLPSITQYVLPIPGAAADAKKKIVKTIPWHGLGHISCKGPDGMCLVTSYKPEPGWDFQGILEEEIYIIWLEDGSYRRLTKHRSSACGYWVQPRSTWSADGKKVVWDSDMWKETGGDNSCKKLGELGGGEIWMMSLVDGDLINPKNAELINGVAADMVGAISWPL